MSARHRLFSTLGVLSVALGAAHSTAARAPGDTGGDAGGVPGGIPGASQPGRWQEHDYQFNYMGFTATYSCDGLADKLQLLLRLSGARPQAKVIPSCARGYGVPDPLAQAQLKFATLQPAPSDTGGAGGEGAGGGVAGGSVDGASVDGVWRHLELSPHHPFDLRLGDCELVEQFRDRLLPLFATRNLQNQITCVPHQDSGSNFSLSFDVFAPAPPPQPAAPPQQSPPPPARSGG